MELMCSSLRQGEVFGLSPDDIDFAEGIVHVRRQVKLLSNNRQLFGLPKGARLAKFRSRSRWLTRSAST